MFGFSGQPNAQNSGYRIAHNAQQASASIPVKERFYSSNHLILLFNINQGLKRQVW